MSVGRVAFVPTLPYALDPNDPPSGGAAPAGGAPPAAQPTPAPAAPAATVTPALAPAPAAPALTLAGGGTPSAPTPAPTPAPAAAVPPIPAPTPALPTLAAGGGAPPPAVPANWPENWRDLAAGDDKAYRAQLDRFDSPAALAKSYRELATKVSSGELKAPPKPLAAGATPEQAAAWRKEQGLPENPQGYVAALALPDGVVPGEADRPLLEEFAKSAHENNWDSKTYNQALSFYYKLEQKLEADRARADADFMLEGQTSLVQEWGPQYKVNQTVVTSFIERMLPKEVGDMLMAARTKDGRIVGNDPAVNRAILSMAKDFNPAATLLPANAGMTPNASVDTRIAEIENKYMRAPQGSADSKTYWSPPMQEEYRNLLTAREQMKGRATRAA